MGQGISTSNALSSLGLAKSEDVAEDITVELRFVSPVPVEKVIATAEAAGEAILSVYHSERSVHPDPLQASKWEVELKADNSPLTKADTMANQIICRELQKMSPHVPIISEENKIMPVELRKGYEYYWLVDPMDGTKEFLKRNGEFTVNIALMYKDHPILGVVHVPVSGKTYWAVKEKGAWLRQGTGEGRKQERIRAAKFGLQDKGLSIVGSSSHPSQQTAEFMELFDSPNTLQVGSSLKLLMVAEGSAHIYPRMVPCCEWDTAAADIIVSEAGGVVLQAGLCDHNGKALEDWKTVLMKEQPLVYNKDSLLNPFFVVFGERRAEEA